MRVCEDPQITRGGGFVRPTWTDSWVAPLIPFLGEMSVVGSRGLGKGEMRFKRAGQVVRLSSKRRAINLW